MAQIEVRALRPEDASWVEDFIRQRWGAAEVVAHGMVYHPQHLPGFVARVGGHPVGLVTYHVQEAACEIVTLDSSRPGEGIGTALVAAVKRAAQETGCRDRHPGQQPAWRRNWDSIGGGGKAGGAGNRL